MGAFVINVIPSTSAERGRLTCFEIMRAEFDWRIDSNRDMLLDHDEW